MSLESAPIEIMHIGSAIIRAHSQRVGSIAHGAKICELLERKLNELKGAGLAAPQIGLPYRVFIAQVRKTEMFPDREESPLFTLINPEMEIISTEELIDYEGCFSVPGFVGIVPRFQKIKLSWTQPDGTVMVQLFENYLARVMQHEMDHLNGMVYLDRMPDMRSLSTRENYMNALLAEN